ncbi:hypothetical protein AAFF_G00110250 [Aldrovandia affinis]|uniref:Endonuclease/exonuclease/phosphatase domain-containing protein n=1 Tax=Aldrovandia affinis TaxID=143900 RepID=A0AAD7RTL3_9TELE|nr:hypothetical protein AAFF_G00110250 [Aldrovandia affinis]
MWIPPTVAPMAADFLTYLDSLNLTQHVNGPIHKRGHTLDLIITGDVPASDLNIFEFGVSDHKAVSLSLAIPSSNHPPPIEKVMKYRNLRNLDTRLFLESIMPTLSTDFTFPC